MGSFAFTGRSVWIFSQNSGTSVDSNQNTMEVSGFHEFRAARVWLFYRIWFTTSQATKAMIDHFNGWESSYFEALIPKKRKPPNRFPMDFPSHGFPPGLKDESHFTYGSFWVLKKTPDRFPTNISHGFPTNISDFPRISLWISHGFPHGFWWLNDD